MIRATLRFRNADLTQDLNDRYKNLFKKGIYFGGSLRAVTGTLNVQLLPFSAISVDGMIIIESSTINTFTIPVGQTTYVCLLAKYKANADPVLEFKVLSQDLYFSHEDKDNLIVFGKIVLDALATEVTDADIDITVRDVIDQLSRSSFRGWYELPTDLPPPTGSKATGTVAIVTNTFTAGDSFTLNGITFPFVTVVVNPNDILIGADEIETAENLTLKLNGCLDPAINGKITAVAIGNVVLITAMDVGSIGNSYTMVVIDTGGINLILSGPNLEGGTDPLGVTSNRPGDTAVVVRGTYGAPELYVWDGNAWFNCTPATFSTLLSLHRQNLLSNEMHMTNDEADAALGSLYPTELPSATNRYVVENDPRMITSDIRDALQGSDGTPSNTNRYVTQAKVFPENSEKAFNPAPVGPYYEMESGDGPIYVGRGSVGSASRWFMFCENNNEHKEYVNSGYEYINVEGVYRWTGSTYEVLNPSLFADLDGYYAGASLYVKASGLIDTPFKIIYAKKKTLKTIGKSSWVNYGPESAFQASKLRVADNESYFRKLLQITPNRPVNTSINIGGASTAALDGSIFKLYNDGMTINYTGGTVNFTSGAVTGGGSSFTPINFAGHSGEWAKYAIVIRRLNPAEILVIRGTDYSGTVYAATKDAVDDPPIFGGYPCAIIAVQDDGSGGIGTIDAVDFVNICRISHSPLHRSQEDGLLTVGDGVVSFGDFSSIDGIQQAIDFIAGDTKIIVKQGTYNPFTVDKDNVTIEGYGNATIIDSSGSGSAVTIDAGAARIDNLRIVDADVGIAIISGNSHIGSRLKFALVTEHISIATGSDFDFIDDKIWTVTVGDGLSSHGDFNGADAIQDAHNWLPSGGKIVVKEGTYNPVTITQNNITICGNGAASTIDGGGGGTAITLTASGVTLSNLKLYNSATGIDVTSGTDNIAAAIIFDTVIDNIDLSSGAHINLIDDKVWNVTVGDAVSSYGDFNGAAAIQDAINWLPSGGKIFVKAGTYNAFNLNKSNIVIEGAGNNTIIDGVSGVQCINLSGSNCVISNLRCKSANYGIACSGNYNYGYGISFDTIAVNSVDYANGSLYNQLASDNTFIAFKHVTVGDGVTSSGDFNGAAAIQSAINTVVAGSKITVKPGTYNAFTVNKDNLVIEGFGNSTIIDGAAGTQCVTVAASNTRLLNFYCTNATIGVNVTSGSYNIGVGLLFNTTRPSEYSDASLYCHIFDDWQSKQVVTCGDGTNSFGDFNGTGAITAAIAAVSTGATIIVKQGSYTGFDINKNGLQILGDNNACVVTTGITCSGDFNKISGLYAVVPSSNCLTVSGSDNEFYDIRLSSGAVNLYVTGHNNSFTNVDSVCSVGASDINISIEGDYNRLNNVKTEGYKALVLTATAGNNEINLVAKTCSLISDAGSYNAIKATGEVTNITLSGSDGNLSGVIKGGSATALTLSGNDYIVNATFDSVTASPALLISGNNNSIYASCSTFTTTQAVNVTGNDNTGLFTFAGIDRDKLITISGVRNYFPQRDVTAGSQGRFATIQAAVDFLGVAGGIVELFDETYTETVSITNDNITIVGKGAKTVVNGSGGTNVFTISGDNIQLFNMTITNGTNGINTSGDKGFGSGLIFTAVTKEVVSTGIYNRFVEDYKLAAKATQCVTVGDGATSYGDFNGVAAMTTAIAAVVAGAVIEVKNGTYNAFTLDKNNVSIFGSGNATIIDGASGTQCINIAADGCRISNLRVQTATYGINFNGTSNRVDKVEFGMASHFSFSDKDNQTYKNHVSDIAHPATLYVGDGTTSYGDFNGASAVGTAITALPTSGGKIILLPGTYNAFTVDKDNVIIEGFGGISIVDGASGTQCITISNSYCRIINVKMQNATRGVTATGNRNLICECLFSSITHPLYSSGQYNKLLGYDIHVLTVGDGVNSFGDFNGATEVSFNSAIAALPASGGKIQVLSGTYNLGAGGIILNKVNTTLEGIGSPVIDGGGGTCSTGIFMTGVESKVLNIKFTNFSGVGNRAIYLNGERVFIKNNIFNNCYYDIDIGGTIVDFIVDNNISY